jgi:parvulin-like peptidyl-prolyl isomerase
MKKIILGLLTSIAILTTAIALENKVYAIVNGDKITSQDITLVLKDTKINFETLNSEEQKNILGSVVDQKLLSQNALKTDLTKEPIFQKALKSLTQNLAFQVWLQKESQKIDIPRKKLKNFYAKNKKLFKQPAQFHARHILVKTKKEAENIIIKLNNSKNLKNDFIKIAKEKSTGPSGKNGGDLGFFTKDRMVPKFSEATRKLKIGSITKNPVKTQFGYHIIFLEDKKNPSIISFEKVQNQILQKLGQDLLMKNVKQIALKLKKQAKIEYK